MQCMNMASTEALMRIQTKIHRSPIWSTTTDKTYVLVDAVDGCTKWEEIRIFDLRLPFFASGE